MTPLEVVKQAEGMTLRDRKGVTTQLRLLPPLTDAEVRELEAQLPCPLPGEARELFSFTGGFEGFLDEALGGVVAEVRFFDPKGGFGLTEVIPHGCPIAHDGAGNFWVADLVSDSSSWGPIFYACHDAPVILFETDSFAHFLSEVLRLGNAPWESEVRDVYDDKRDVWGTNPGMLTQEQCLGSADVELQAFARTLDEAWLIKDMRHPEVGDGFSWGRFGARAELRRFGETRLFAYQQPQRKSLWQRVLGR